MGYSSPVREGLIYVSMSRIEFSGTDQLGILLNISDTEQYDRPDAEDSRNSIFEQLGINSAESRRGKYKDQYILTPFKVLQSLHVRTVTLDNRAVNLLRTSQQYLLGEVVLR